MSSITFDTMEFVDTLTAAGVPEAQAKAEAKAINSAFKQIAESKDVATKQDLAQLQHDIAIVESNLRKDMAELKSEILRAMLVQVFAITGIVIAVVKFVH